MPSWTPLRKYTAIVFGSGSVGGFAAYFYHKSTANTETKLIYKPWIDQKQPINANAIWNTNWDLREPKFITKPIDHNTTEEQEQDPKDEQIKYKSNATRHIILVRHGEYNNLDDGDDTQVLTKRGRIQAKYTGQRLQQLGIKWDDVIVSTMKRAQETSEIILKEIKFDRNKIQNCSFIREGAPVQPEPSRKQKSNEVYQRDGSRIETAFRKYFYRASPEHQNDSYTLIVGHANVIRYFICRALQFPPEAWIRFTLNHASITWISIYPSGNVSVKLIGDSGFMPPEHLTFKTQKIVKNVVEEKINNKD